MNWLELFEDMSSGELSSEQEGEVREKIDSDPEVKKLYQDYLAGKRLIQLKTYRDDQVRIQNILAHLRETEEDESSRPQAAETRQSKGLTGRQWGSIAAIVLGVILVAMFVIISRKTPCDYEAIAQRLLEKESLLIDKTMGARDSSDALIDSAAYALDALQYDKAIHSLRQLIERFPESIRYQMLLGKALLKNKQIEEAISIFNSETLVNSMFSQERKWYLALAYLYLNQPETSIGLCKELLADSSGKVFANQAAALQQELETCLESKS